MRQTLFIAAVVQSLCAPSVKLEIPVGELMSEGEKPLASHSPGIIKEALSSPARETSEFNILRTSVYENESRREGCE